MAPSRLPRLHAAHVCVVGVGGVGSWVVEGLARSGVGAVTMVDLDDVCLTNVNRQLPALEGSIGRPKVEALAERVRAINPDCRVTTRSEFFTAATAEHLLAPRFDWVVDCVDLMSNKALLIASCVQRGRPVLTVGGAGGRRDATRIRTGDLGDSHGDELLRQVRKDCDATTVSPRARAITTACLAFPRTRDRCTLGPTVPARPSPSPVRTCGSIVPADLARGFL